MKTIIGRLSSSIETGMDGDKEFQRKAAAGPPIE